MSSSYPAQVYIDLLTPFVAPVVTWLLARYLKVIPRVLLGPICVALGTLGNSMASVLVAGDDVNLTKAAFLGVAGIGLRELQNQMRKSTGLVTDAEHVEMTMVDTAKAKAKTVSNMEYP